MGKKRYFRVFGHTEVTVSRIVVIDEDDIKRNERALCLGKAAKEFCGIHEYLGNGGDDKLIGVEHPQETIAADEPVEFDDYMEIGEDEFNEHQYR